MKQVRYLMIGGFLGAGKTTALLRLADYLQKRGLRAALITNDQSTGLVDTGRVQAVDRPVGEVTGGCFCCKFDTLIAAAQNLTCQGSIDVLLAEPVGSCTDVRATVSYPLRQLFGERYEVGPLSVLIDPVRCAQALGLDPETLFTDKVNYIYRKQLEEADLIVINKCDAIAPELRRKLVSTLRRGFASAQVLEVSCQTGEGLAEWFDLLLSETLGDRPAMEVDYDIYADGEALLGWLNARASFRAEPAVNGADLMLAMMDRLKKQLSARGVEIAHCKMSVESGQPSNFSAVSLTSTQSEPAITWASEIVLPQGHLLLNLRAEADPDLLRNDVMTALFTLPRVSMRMEEIFAFRPGRPTPTHRMAMPAS